jgi:energy-coupling factor transporter transmembrane protein EcfT
MQDHLNHIQSPATNEEKTNSPRHQKINRAAAIASIVFSLIALLTVLSGFLLPPHPPETDEGAAAHIFQLSIAALFPTIIAFLATADWKTPWRSVRPLIFPALALTIAFTVLFYAEHH